MTSVAERRAYQASLDLTRRFRRMITEARGYVFHDGMASPLSEAVHNLIGTHGSVAVAALEQVIEDCQVAEIEAVVEILRQLGLIEQPHTKPARLNLLAKMLFSPDAGIRDAALLGLSFLDDPAALSPLRQARRRETQPWLVKNLDQVIRQLEPTLCPGT